MRKTLLCQIANASTTQMMSYVIRTTDKKTIVIDGGTVRDADRLFDRLKSITGSEKPHIDGWFLTHAHSDHIDALMELLSRGGLFTLDALYYHFPSVQFVEKNEPGEAHTLARFYALLPLVAAQANVVSSGDSYNIGAARFDVLYTADPAFTMNAVNNTSTVLRMTASGQTVLFLGDLGKEAGKKLLREHGSGLQSDFCQMAHHGQNGVDFPVYKAVRPRACLWCTPDWLWNNDAGKGYNTHIWKTIEVRKWMDRLNVNTHFVCKDGDHRIMLPYSFDGAASQARPSAPRRPRA